MVRRFSRRFRVGVLAFTLVFAPAAFYVAPVLDSRVPCERAQEWARANPGNLPTTAARLAAFPESLRRTIFSELPPEVKATVWKQQLLEFGKSEQRTVEQRAIIEEIVRQITPIVYSTIPGPDRDSTKSKIAGLVTGAKNLFAPTDYIAFFKWDNRSDPNVHSSVLDSAQLKRYGSTQQLLQVHR
jgi:hypothetical protein